MRLTHQDKTEKGLAEGGRGQQEMVGEGGGREEEEEEEREGERAGAESGGGAGEVVVMEDEALTTLLTARQARRLLEPLVKLRQACCHPQVGEGGLKTARSGATPMTMGEVLRAMIGKARVDAEEAQRALAGSCNGLAAVSLILGDAAEAVRQYRHVLRLDESSGGLVRLDVWQRLHAMYNLAETLERHPDVLGVVGHTLRDSEYKREAEELATSLVVQSSAKMGAEDAEYSKVRVREWSREGGKHPAAVESSDAGKIGLFE